MVIYSYDRLPACKRKLRQCYLQIQASTGSHKSAALLKMNQLPSVVTNLFNGKSLILKF